MAVRRTSGDQRAMTLARVVATLRERRRERKMTQAELGRLLGYSYLTVSAWERRVRRPPLEVLEEWARLLDYRLDFRLTDLT